MKIRGYFSKQKGVREQKRLGKTTIMGYYFEFGDYIAEGDVCHYHVMSMF